MLTAVNGKHMRLAPAVAVMCVPPDETGIAWPYVKAHITAGREALGEIFDEKAMLLDLAQGHILLWTAWREKEIISAMTTRLMKGADGLVCHMLDLGGDGLEILLPLLGRIESYAKQEGCVSIRCQGRVGWQKVLADYRRIGVILEKGL